MLQMKILHRILPTNAWLFKCNLTNTKSCTFCKINTETIQHLFWECPITKSLWLQLAEWLRKTSTAKFELNMENIILGTFGDSIILEHIKLITKEYIYYTKLKEGIPNIKGLISIIIHKCKIEKHHTTPEKLKTKWGGNLLRELGI